MTNGWFTQGDCGSGRGLVLPSQGFPPDRDVRQHYNMDFSQRLVDVNLHFCPMFDIEILQDDAERLVYVDIDGVKRVFLKDEATIPSSTRMAN